MSETIAAPFSQRSIVLTITSRQTAAYEALMLALTPVMTWVALRFVLINQDGYIDPWFYTGYGRIFPAMYAQFGWAYYAARFPAIALNEAASLLPPIVGFVLLRYLLLFACGVPLYIWARQSFGRAVALLSYMVLFWNPLLPRILLWDLTTFVSVPLALGGAALWLIPGRCLALRRFAAGMFWAAAAASHIFTGTAIGSFVIVQAIQRIRNRDIGGLIRQDILMTSAGAAVCLLLGVAYYLARIGPFNPMTAIRMTLWAISVGSQFALSHKTPVLSWATREYYVYVPPLCVLLACVLLGRRLRENTSVSSVWWFAALYTSFYLTYQLVFGRFVLETFYYFAHLTVVVFLLVPIILAELAATTDRRVRARVLAVAAVALAVIPVVNRIAPAFVERVSAVTDGNARAAAALIVAALLVVGSAAWQRRSHAVAVTVAAAFALLMQVFPFLNSYHRIVFKESRYPQERDVYLAALSMLDVFGAYARPETSVVMLWYCARQGSLQSIGSSLLLFTLQKSFSDARDACESRIGDYERERLKLKPAYVLMLDDTGSSFPVREAALYEEGYASREVLSRIIGGSTYHTVMRLIRLDQVAPSPEDRRVLATPPMLTVHWTEDDLRTLGHAARYANSPVAALTRAKDGNWAFNPVTNQDHLATPYIPIPLTQSERWVAIQVKPSPSAGANCFLYVQNHKFDDIGRVPCGAEAAKHELPVVVPVPPTAKSIRMYLADPNLSPIVLPHEVSVTLHARDATHTSGTSQK